jgi:hypothetical protein
MRRASHYQRFANAAAVRALTVGSNTYTMTSWTVQPPPHRFLVAALTALADEGAVLAQLLTRAIERYKAAARWMQ